jgi:antitoxin (DNA-binding transcriptional repressor) of toxin-antitoxin stability system
MASPNSPVGEDALLTQDPLRKGEKIPSASIAPHTALEPELRRYRPLLEALGLEREAHECLKLMDEVARTGRPVVITKHGKPIAQLVPIPAQSRSLFGYMKNTVQIKGDVISPVDEEWSALSGDEDQLFAVAPKKSRARRSSRNK